MKKVLINIIIYVSSFYFVYYLKYGTLLLKDTDIVYLIVLQIVASLSSLLLGKFALPQKSFIATVKILFKSFILTLGVISLLTNLITPLITSRALLIGSISLAFMLELIYYPAFSKSSKETTQKPKIKISYIPFFIELIITISIIFFTFKTYEYLNGLIFLRKIQISVVILVIWCVNGIFSQQFLSKQANINLYKNLWIHLKSYILLILLMSIMAFAMIEIEQIKKLVIQQTILYSALSTIFVGLYYIYAKKPKTDEVTTEFLTITELNEKEIVKASNTVQTIGIYTFCYNLRSDEQLYQMLKSIYLKKFDRIFDFIRESINLKSFDPSRTIVIRSADLYNVEVLPHDTIELYINLHQINDMRYLNKYFYNINRCLKKGGIFISKYEPTRLRLKRFNDTYPFYLAKMFYFFDFVWRRVIPKLPFLQRFYFALTKGSNRVISMAEMLGRLYFNKFDIVALREIDDFQYFIASKINDVTNDEFPSYGPLLKMRRIGKDGKNIFVYKLRTMYPYSEYIQKFTYDIFGTKDGDKITNDFRITSWGRVLRKIWIDELPMLINFLKGELKLVGVRPLSQHKYSTYPDDLKAMRIKYKPGLVPPYYADMPANPEEFIESEKHYLQLYAQSPFRTDIKYFFKAAYNILFRSARSS
ncbi:MAG: sugar transferase [Candidatus Hodarchaeota archaeon]